MIVNQESVAVEIEPNQNLRGHLLMPDELKSSIPKLLSQRKLGEQAIVYVQFHGTNYWQWFITEYDGNDRVYGMLMGHEIAWGEFSLKELASIVDKGWNRNSEHRAGVRRVSYDSGSETVEHCIASAKASMPWRWGKSY